MDGGALEGGFDNAPVQAAQAFRAAMQAMARPGRLYTITGATAPAPLSIAAGTLILTLCDQDTPLALGPSCDTSAVRAWIAFHTGAPVARPAAAQFALGAWEELLPLSAYPAGTPEYPDRSTTLIVEMPHLSKNRAGRADTRLTGPGIREAERLNLPDAAALQWNAGRFPLGLDFYFTHGDRLAGLPRTTQVGS